MHCVDCLANQLPDRRHYLFLLLRLRSAAQSFEGTRNRNNKNKNWSLFVQVFLSIACYYVGRVITVVVVVFVQSLHLSNTIIIMLGYVIVVLCSCVLIWMKIWVYVDWEDPTCIINAKQYVVANNDGKFFFFLKF